MAVCQPTSTPKKFMKQYFMSDGDSGHRLFSMKGVKNGYNSKE